MVVNDDTILQHCLKIVCMKSVMCICSHQAEGVVGIHQVFDTVLFQHHYIGEIRAALPGTVLTVHHVQLLTATLTRHKQQVKNLHL